MSRLIDHSRSPISAMEPEIDPALDAETVAAVAAAAAHADASEAALLSPHLMPPSPSLNDDEAKTKFQDETEAAEALDVGMDEGDRPAKRVRGIVPGSSADYRRKEANRLAAVRSRYRASDKRTGLVKHKDDLEEENTRLKEEIARLEEELGVDSALDDSVPTPVVNGDAEGRDGVRTEAVAKKGGIGVGRGDKPLSLDGLEHDTENNGEASSGDAAQDSHSRTILAALMSNAAEADGFGAAEGGEEDEWMQGVEEIFKEAESNGRLGELATIAAGRGGKGKGRQSKPEGGAAPLTLSDDPASAAAPTGGAGQTINGDAGKIQRVDFSRQTAAAATSSAMAISLNVEMERLLREDLVATKLAIGRVEREIQRLQNSAPSGAPEDGALMEDGTSASLPRVLFSTDMGTLRRHTDEQIEHIESLHSQMHGHRSRVMMAKDAKLGVEARLAGLVMDLQRLTGGDSAEKQAQANEVLRGLTGYVGTLLGTVEAAIPYADTTNLSSPALALRIRGRPSKTITGLLTRARPSPARGNGANEGESGAMGTPTATRRRGRRSGLAKQVMSRSLSNGKDQTENQQLQARHDSPTAIGDQEDGDPSAAETERLLHHLRDTSTFADLLPAQDDVPIDPSLVDSALSNRNDHQGSSAANGAVVVDNAAGGPLVGTLTGEDGPIGEISAEGVLSRYKKGPPGSCDICGRIETSVWRKLTLGDIELKVCNACGLYHTKFKVIRPTELWGDGKSIRKRRAAPRGSTSSAAAQGEDGADGDEIDTEAEDGAGGKRMKLDGGEAGIVEQAPQNAEGQDAGSINGEVDEEFGQLIAQTAAGASGSSVAGGGAAAAVE